MRIGSVEVTKDQDEAQDVVINGRHGLAAFVSEKRNIVKVVFDDGSNIFLDASKDVP